MAIETSSINFSRDIKYIYLDIVALTDLHIIEDWTIGPVGGVNSPSSFICLMQAHKRCPVLFCKLHFFFLVYIVLRSQLADMSLLVGPSASDLQIVQRLNI